MNLKGLISEYRDRADDTRKPFRADDDRVTRWLNEAAREAAVRARLLFDAASPWLTIPVVAGKHTYDLNPSVFAISSAYTDKFKITLTGTDQSVLDEWGSAYTYRGRRGRGIARSEYWAQWRTQKGCPRYFVQDGSKLRLVPIPDNDDTMHLEVYRIPLPSEELRTSNPEGCPVLAMIHHDGLVDWALYRAYLRRDEDQYDPKLAADHLGLFEARFGQRPDANVMRKRNERRRHTTTINWPG